MLKCGLIGLDGRTSALEICLRSSPNVERVDRLGTGKGRLTDEDKKRYLELVVQMKIDHVMIGPEGPLAEGIVEFFESHGIKCVGPTSKVARIETSKAFARELLDRHGIDGNPEYRVFKSTDGVADYLSYLGDFVVKPDGLTGGKGVKVSGDHLENAEEGLAYCDDVLRSGHSVVVVEEKLQGQEFSLQSFCDGVTLRHMPLVQDHKRAFNGDTGPNTGGMGSYSCANLSLPFLTDEHVRDAQQINEKVVAALAKDQGAAYKGVLYGGFILTASGVRLIEYNARFGDPEALNVLTVLDVDFGDICEAIVDGTLHQLDVSFKRLATVCKYVVPEGYPSSPGDGEITNIPPESDQLKIYPAAVEKVDGRVRLMGSRAIAFVGVHPDLFTAADIAEQAAASVQGPVRHRSDIGTRDLVERRVRQMESLLGGAMAHT